MSDEIVRIKRDILEEFCRSIFLKLGLTDFEADISSKVLVNSDYRGISSHGVSRLWRYVNGIKAGVMVPDAPTEVVMETSTSIVVDAHCSMGAPVSVRTMETVISKARESGSAFGCVRDSNHFGIAGYYAMMALDEDMIGFSMTNSAVLGVPTFGSQIMFGTNPLSFAAPADKEKGFVLDMSTMTVTRGKIEYYKRLGKELPEGWAVDKNGNSAKDPESLLNDMLYHLKGGILPLGGAGEECGGHKGYGLAVMVDILCSVLSGGLFGPAVKGRANTNSVANHFFGALRIDAFRDPKDFKRDMDKMLGDLRNSPLADGAERIYFAGLKERETEKENARDGVPIIQDTYDHICSIGKEYGVSM